MDPQKSAPGCMVGDYSVCSSVMTATSMISHLPKSHKPMIRGELHTFSKHYKATFEGYSPWHV